MPGSKASKAERRVEAAPERRFIEVRADRVSRRFGTHVVLDGIALDIFNGDIVAIVGGSGSGKTVLLDHLAGLLPAQKGRVLVADHDGELGAEGWPLVDLARLAPEQLDAVRLHWSVVFQHNALFSGTVFENIALWLREHTSLGETEIARQVKASLQAVQLDPEDVTNKERDALSGGMAKRVAIARALATNPVVIFYDEPTTGLDPIISAHIHELVWNTHNQRPVHWVAEGRPKMPSPLARRTSIIVTHDRELLRRLRPRVVMLGQGKVCFDGSYDEFTRTSNPQAQQYLKAMPVLHARPMEDSRQ